MKNENSLNEAGLDSKIELSDEIAILNEIEYYNTEFPKPSQESWNWNEICLKNQLEFDPRQILEYPKEKRIELITMYHLENDAVDVFENIILNNGDYIEKMKKYSEIKNGFLGIIDKDDIENEVERIKKYVSNNDTEYVDLLTECSLARDTGYKKLEDDGIAYTYFLSMKNCRKYVSENLGYIQIYGRSGLYNIHSKTIDDYRKSKDMLKRIKVLQIKVKKTKQGEEEAYSFEGLDKYYFIDEQNKNHKLTWNPNRDKSFTENRIEYFNEYSPIQYQGANHGKDLSLIYYHVKHYLCGDNDEAYNYFIAVVSDMVRNPGRKLPVCIVMNGEGGVGKSFLFDKLFRKLFGDMYGFKSNKVSGRFNKELENKICFLIEELSHQDNKNESNIIKDMISNPKIRIERKGIDSYEIENCIRFFICSNGEWSVRIENNNSSRRYLVCDVSTEIPDNDYFNKLSELIKGDRRKGYENEKALRETIEQFIHDMGQIDISVLETDPPETESKKLSQSYSKGIPEKQLEGFFEKIINNDGCYGDFGSVKIVDKDNDTEVNSTVFWNCFIDYLKDRRQQIPDGFSNYGRILSKWFGKGCSKLDTKTTNGKRNRILTFPPVEVVEGVLSII